MILLYAAYLISTVLFILGLKQLGSPQTARQGNFISSLGMLVGVCATLVDVGFLDLPLILIAISIGRLLNFLLNLLQ